jgi:recombination protein RecR
MYPKSFKKLIDHFASLPSVGPKMAERLVLHLFKQEAEKLEVFAEDLRNLKTSLNFCRRCFNICEKEYCAVCSDSSRDQQLICVVEDPLDAIAIEKTGQYKGIYHILGGLISPLKNKDEFSLRLKELENRVKEEATREIFIATNPTTEGDTTALYIRRIFKDQPVKITRLARGLATGGDIEYADEITLTEALTNRRELV